MLELSGPVFSQFPFDCISQDQSSLRPCWQQQAFQGNPPFCVTRGLWPRNTFARWIFTQPSPILCPVLSPARSAGAGEDEPGCGMGLGQCKGMRIYSSSLTSSAGRSPSAFKGEEGTWSCVVMTCQTQFFIVMTWLKCSVVYLCWLFSVALLEPLNHSMFWAGSWKRPGRIFKSNS